MRMKLASILRKCALVMVMTVAFAADQAALAQSASCSQLSNTLNSLNRNREFRNLQSSNIDARQVAGDLQDLESLFVRGGCQQQLNTGARLSRDCRTVARRITRARSNYNQLAANIETGQAVAQQRELILQQVARFGCGTGSSARVVVTTRQNRSSLSNLFDRLFGREGDIIDDGFGFGFGGLSTLRTVCVRTCDGYYWPVSFSTVGEFLTDDAGQCQSQCPGSEVNLYYYRNPGESPDDMINLNGMPYKSLENAFRYRREFDKSCSCKQQIEYGSIVLTASSDSSSTRAFVEFDDLKFPMPVRDPRRTVETVEIVVLEAIQVPLPRRRPLRAGEDAPVIPITAPVANVDTRIVKFGDKSVRIVGPDTPYAQSEAAGS